MDPLFGAQRQAHAAKITAHLFQGVEKRPGWWSNTP